MTTYSKLLPYTCYEIGHTWHHSCTKSSFDMFISSWYESARLYGMVYLLSALVSRKKMSKKYALQLLKYYIQSCFFLSLNGSYFVASFCVLRRLLGHVNIITAGFLPGFTASILAILAERQSRRSLLAIYVANVASECLWRVLNARGYVTPIHKGEVILFALSMSLFGFYFKSSSEFSPLINSILKFIMGEDESGLRQQKVSRNEDSDGKWRTAKCPHTGSCIGNMLKAGASGLVKGYLVEVSFRTLTSLARILRKPSLLIQILSSQSSRGTALFFAWFASVFKLTCCIGRWKSKEERPVHGAVAGGLAGLGMAFNSSTTIALYSFWKALEALYSKGIEARYLPVIPGGIELLYSVATAYLFHIAVLESFNMKPSYWRFLQNLTGGKMGEYNRILLNSYGLDSGKTQKWPSYDKNHLSTEFLKEFSDQMR